MQLLKRLIAILLTIVLILPFMDKTIFGGNFLRKVSAATDDGYFWNCPQWNGMVSTWDCIYFGNYMQSDTSGKTKEPIKWRVLLITENEAVLMADKILDIQKYNEERQAVTWEDCSLRKWLNTTFCDLAFTKEE